ncbi:MAG TPA: (Fe-S)-binding protein [Methanosarcinales archaeon]|nr:(Fe-S)-binding protein [Methanosarcinales archaeon]
MARETPSITTDYLTPTQLLEIDACTRCGECLNWCPVYNVVDRGMYTFAPKDKEITPKTKYEFTPLKKIKTLRDFMNQSYGLRAKLFGPKKIDNAAIQEFSEFLYHCSTCGVCANVCESGIDTVELWEAIRANLVKRGNGPFGKQSFFPKLMAKYGNPYQGKQEDRLCWLPEDIKFADNSENAYFVGCTATFRQQVLAVSTVRILNHLGIEFTMLGPDEWCCGSALIRTGQRETENVVREFAKRNIEGLKEKGVKNVYFACAGCYRASVIDWPKYYEGKIPFKSIHMAVYMSELLKEGKLKWKHPINKTVTYHDPCHLGRHVFSEIKDERVFESPREVYKSFPEINFIEMERIKEMQRCCGAGGGCKAGIPDMALSIAKTRVEDAQNVNADILSSTCPFCRRNLMDARDAMKAEIEVEDLVVLAAKSLGLDVTIPPNPYIS